MTTVTAKRPSSTNWSNISARIKLFGTDPTAAFARYAAMLLSRTGRTAGALDATGLSFADQMLDLQAGDGLLVLGYTQPSREVSAVFRVARRLILPTVLIADTADSKLALLASAVVPMLSGQAERVAFHGVTLVALDALVPALAASAPDAAVAAFERLNDLRMAVAGKRGDVG